MQFSYYNLIVCTVIMRRHIATSLIFLRDQNIDPSQSEIPMQLISYHNDKYFWWYIQIMEQ